MSQPNHREIIGVIEFSGTLYHGSATKNFDPACPPYLDLTAPYRDTNIETYEDYGKKDSTSVTLGPAFYTTDDRNEAIQYSLTRAKHSGEPITLLYQLNIQRANFFDFRSQGGRSNGRVSLEVAKAWQDYYTTMRGVILPELIKREYNRLNSYAYFLKDFIDRLETGREFEPELFPMSVFPDSPARLLGIDPNMKRDLSLRDLLRSLHSLDSDYIWAPFGGLWVRFVEDELGCKGVVLLEGGEGEKFSKSTPTYAIYNLGIVKDQQIEVLSN